MSETVRIQTVDGWLVIPTEIYQQHLVRPQAPVVPPEPLLDSEQLSAVTGIPATWYEEAARQQRLPHHRIGRYVRFRLSEVALATREERRGSSTP